MWYPSNEVPLGCISNILAGGETAGDGQVNI